MKSTVIHQTHDYKKFVLSEQNRDVNPSALTRVKNSMEKYGWLKAYPMHVVSRDGRLAIIDGQHRFSAAQKLNLPVFYVVCQEEEDFKISDINLAQRPWTNVDFATSYHNQQNPHYTKLIDFSQRHGLPIGICAKILMGIGGRGTATHEIRDGRFRVRNLEVAEKIGAIVSRIKKVVPWGANSNFVSALVKATSVKGFDCSHFLAKAEANPGLLILQPTIESFLDLIEKVYNYRTSSAQKMSIKFEALKGSK